MLDTLLGKRVQRAFYLFGAALGPYLVWSDYETLQATEVSLRLAISPLALMFFNITFLSGERSEKVTAVGILLFGLAVTLAAFSFDALHNPIATQVAAGGLVIVIISLPGLRWAFVPKNNP